MMICEEARKKAIIVPDGEYERYLAAKPKDEHSDRCHSCYAGCRGGCGVDGERCRLHEGRNEHGHIVSWCMCGSKSRSNELFLKGLKVAEEYLPPEEFERYKATIEPMLKDE